MAQLKENGKKPILWFLCVFIALGVTACGGKKIGATAPVAAIQVAETRGVAPFKVNFRSGGSSSPNGGISSYVWTFPDGTKQTGQNTTYTFAVKGTYRVDLTVEDESGLSDTASVSISVVSQSDRFSVSGVVSSLAFTDTDSDVNDPNATYANNDGDKPENIQEIANPINISGFASKTPTRWNGDRFANVADVQDHFKVHLEAKDYVSLSLADYANADLDLYLYEAATMNMVSYSSGSGAYESLQVQKDGDYIAVVEATSGFTNYVLEIGQKTPVAGASAQGSSADFAENQVILKMDENVSDNVADYADAAQIHLSHRHKYREMLGRINPLNPQTHNMLWGKMREEGFSKRLAVLNPESAGKLKTIQAIKKMKSQKGITLAEPNYRVKTLMTPNDPFFVYQWQLESLHMRQAWDITTGNPDVIIAVVDTGVYIKHPDLQNQLVSGYDFVSDPTVSNDGDGIDPDPTDPGDADGLSYSSWHGTHVTGIAVAQVNNRRGVVGVAPNCKVMPVRAIGMDGGLMYDVLQAVRYAAGLENDSNTVPDEVADVINMSLGGEGYSSAPQELFNEVREKGIIVVASSGNENTGVSMYPASYQGVVSVGASTLSGNRAIYSNTGPTLDILAYGGNAGEDSNKDGYEDGILSTMIFETNDLPDPYYGMADGTSMAAPQVSAVVALMKSVYPALTPDLFDSLLVSGEITLDKGEPGRDNDNGYGLVDGLKAVKAAQGLSQGGTTSAVIADDNVMVFDTMNTEKILEIRGLGNGSISISNYFATEDWLTITGKETDVNGLGSYKVNVNTDGFADGTYRAYLDFSTDKNSNLRVEVILRIGAVSTVGNAGFLYVLLVNSKDGEVADSVESAGVDGLYLFEFKDVPVGDYYITSGSDVDNNGLICEYGESCGMYPVIDSFEIFHLVGDMRDVQFNAGLYSDDELLGLQTLFLGQSRSSSSFTPKISSKVSSKMSLISP